MTEAELKEFTAVFEAGYQKGFEMGFSRAQAVVLLAIENYPHDAAKAADEMYYCGGALARRITKALAKQERFGKKLEREWHERTETKPHPNFIGSTTIARSAGANSLSDVSE